MAKISSGNGGNSVYAKYLTLLILLVLASTPAKAALKASSASANSVTLTWTAPGDDGSSGTASQYDIRYALSPISDLTWNSAIQMSGEPVPQPGGSVESFTVDGLEAGTQYYFAIRAADEVPNWSVLSNVVVFTTDPETDPPSDIVDLASIGITSTSVTLSWTAPGDDGTVGTATTYDLRYATSAATLQNWDGATPAVGEPSPAAAGSSEEFTVTGLYPGTTYYFAIKTADEVPNWSGISNTPTATTSEEQTAPAAVVNLAAGSVTASSIALSWTATGDDGNAGTASQYDLRYSATAITPASFASATPVPDVPAPGPAGQSESFTVTGLNPSSTYYFALKVADEVPNWSTISNVVSAATGVEQTPPNDIANLNVILPTRTSLTLIWTAPGDDSTVGTASQYDVRYATTPITTGDAWDAAEQLSGEAIPAPAGTPETLTVADLVEATTYYFAIKTADEVPNWSAISNVASGTTAADNTPPAGINDLEAATGSAEGTVDLSWTAPGDDNLLGAASVYEIRYAYDSITAASWQAATIWPYPPTPDPSGARQSITVNNLEPGAAYFFGIRAHDDAANVSALSNVDSAVAKYELALGYDDDEDQLPAEYLLSQNYPNPFNPSTQIRFTVPRTSETELSVFNSLGQQVVQLVYERLEPGEYFVEWDGTDDLGTPVATGVYFYRMAAGDYVETRKMMLMK